MSVIHVTTQSFETDVAGSSLPVLVDFWAAWCGPCRMIAPTLEELANDYEGRVVIAKIDVDENPELAKKYGVMSIPTLLLFKGGEVKAKTMGAQPKEKLEEFLDEALQG